MNNGLKVFLAIIATIVLIGGATAIMVATQNSSDSTSRMIGIAAEGLAVTLGSSIWLSFFKRKKDINSKPIPRLRPLIISILTVLGFIGIPLSVFGIFTMQFSWLTIYSAIFVILSLISYIAIWKMLKKGVYIFFGISVIGILVSLTQYFNFITLLLGLVVPIIYLSAIAYHWKKFK
jgi:cytochrome bd-type quinol oxidase subunit 2